MRFVLLPIIAFVGFTCSAFAQQEDSVEIIYDTVYESPDTIRQKEEVTVVQIQHYVLDLSAGVSVGFSSPAIGYSGDTCNAPGRAWAVSVGIPFRANFRPFVINSGIYIERLTSRWDISCTTASFVSEQETVIDTLDLYYVVIKGDTIPRALTASRDTNIVYSKFDSRDSSVTNRYTFVSLPVLFGYQHDWKHWSLAGSAGFVVSYLVSADGRNRWGNPLSVVREPTSLLHRLFVSPAVQVSGSIPLSRDISVSADISYSFPAQTLHEDGVFDVRIHRLAFNLSISYHF